MLFFTVCEALFIPDYAGKNVLNKIAILFGKGSNSIALYWLIFLFVIILYLTYVLIKSNF
jgi:hypothetical protein